MTELISISEAAELMQTRPDFVRQMIAKGRLKMDADERLDKCQVIELKALIGRLRGNGIATMVKAADEQPDQPEV